MSVFLSFNSNEREQARSLKQAIEQARPDIDIFLDETHLKYGYFWQQDLFEEIEKRDVFITLIGPTIGDWQRAEYYVAHDKKVRTHNSALEKNQKDKFLLLPIITVDHRQAPQINLPGLSQIHWIGCKNPTAPDPLSLILRSLDQLEVSEPPIPWKLFNPYRGLPALEEQDADFFFGRQKETKDIIETIMNDQDKVITLVGNSGVGKTSLIKAGVVSSLKRRASPDLQPWPDDWHDSRKWAYLTFKPDDNPIRALVSAFTRSWFEDARDPERENWIDKWEDKLKNGSKLNRLIDVAEENAKEAGIIPPQKIVLYIDQGEELYSRATNDSIKRFSELISEGSNDQRLIILMTLRSDYYGQLQDNETLWPVTHIIDIPPLRAEALKEVLSKPAELLQVKYENSSLVDSLLEQLADTYIDKEKTDNQKTDTTSPTSIHQHRSISGALPLLSDFMADLWHQMQEREDGLLKTADQPDKINVAMSLANRANTFLHAYRESEDVIRRLFTLKLALVPPEGEPVRRRVLKKECTEEEWRLIEIMAGSADTENYDIWRLLVTGEQEGEPTAEVAHEILLKKWDKLGEWLKSERNFLIWKGNIERFRKRYDTITNGLSQNNSLISVDNDTPQIEDPLLKGFDLAEARNWFSVRHLDIGDPESQYIQKSIASDNDHKKKESEREARMWQAELEAINAKASATRTQAAASRKIAKGMFFATFLLVTLASIAGWFAWLSAKQDSEFLIAEEKFNQISSVNNEHLEKLKFETLQLNNLLITEKSKIEHFVV